jgi:prepilin-type processing-associated H-X9-DG protein
MPYFYQSYKLDSAGRTKAAPSYTCPTHTQKYLSLGKATTRNYAMSAYLGLNSNAAISFWRRMANLPNPSRTLCITEIGYWGAYNPSMEANTYYLGIGNAMYKDGGVHQGANNILWCDGHVAAFKNPGLLTASPYKASTSAELYGGYESWTPGFSPSQP